MTGSTNKKAALEKQCVLHLSRDAGFYATLHSSQEAKRLEDSVQGTLKFFKEIAETKDIRALLQIESLCLKNDPQRPLSSGDASSLKTGLRQCDKAVETLDHMQQFPEIYKSFPSVSAKSRSKADCRWTAFELSLKAMRLDCATCSRSFPKLRRDLWSSGGNI